jgi:4-amino-4-deoxy-L-arabinose transferase-like glycosyltransferase
MAAAISGPVILLWALLTGRWKDLWPAYIPSGALLFILIAAPWHILASIQNPEFAYKYFIVEHFLRYTTSMHLRTQPIYFFIPVIILGLFPWTCILWQAFKTNMQNDFSQKQKSITIFLMIWAVWTFGFFSISNSKLVPYILPSFVPLSIILGTYWVKLYQPDYQDSARKGILIFASLSLLLSIGGFCALWLFPQLIDHKPYLWVDFTILSGAILITALLSLLFLYKHQLHRALSAIPAVASILVFGVIHLMPELQRPSIKQLALTIQTLKQPGDIVGCYRAYYQDLPVYTNQLVTVVDVKGELEFGCDAEDCSQWMVNEEQFLKQWASPPRFFVVARNSHIQDLLTRHPSFRFIPLAKDQANVLISNR